jgi:hypothetical protein
MHRPRLTGFGVRFPEHTEAALCFRPSSTLLRLHQNDGGPLVGDPVVLQMGFAQMLTGRRYLKPQWELSIVSTTAGCCPIDESRSP